MLKQKEYKGSIAALTHHHIDSITWSVFSLSLSPRFSSPFYTDDMSGKFLMNENHLSFAFSSHLFIIFKHKK
jgi:hypothetical protein